MKSKYKMIFRNVSKASKIFKISIEVCWKSSFWQLRSWWDKIGQTFCSMSERNYNFLILFPGKKWLKNFSWYCEVKYDSICQKLLLNVQKILFFQFLRETLQKVFPWTRLFESLEDEKNSFGLQLIKIVIYRSF